MAQITPLVTYFFRNVHSFCLSLYAFFSLLFCISCFDSNFFFGFSIIQTSPSFSTIALLDFVYSSLFFNISVALIFLSLVSSKHSPRWSDPNCIFSSDSHTSKTILMKKYILKLDLHDDKDKRKAMKTVSTLSGIDSITVDMKGQTLTVVGTVDPVSLATRLRKYWPTNIVSVGPAKEPEKKEEPKKEEPKKEEAKKEEEPKKEEAKKEEEPKKEEAKKEEPKKEPEPLIIVPYNYRPYYPPMNTSYYVHHSMEENPNACFIL